MICYIYFQVYLVDYGLSFVYQYSQGGHKPYTPDPGYCYGTLPFTSIDAHDGASK
uniref:Uncharacterized protein n=1 Tax=Amphimedon queenslandica TaxID=400682 RepID=A0A1X7VIF8_AMPQE